jgi:hypothetical protein
MSSLDEDEMRRKNPFNEDSNEDGDDESETSEKDPGAMMSLFASYYGIDNMASSPNGRSSGDLIDSACFDPDSFVKARPSNCSALLPTPRYCLLICYR